VDYYISANDIAGILTDIQPNSPVNTNKRKKKPVKSLTKTLQQLPFNIA